MNKNILITGGCGFIGSNLVEFFLKQGNKVIIIDDLSIGNRSNVKKNKNLIFIKKKIQDIGNIKLKSKIDICIHLAAKAEILISKEKENLYFDDNVIGLQHVLKFCSQKKIKKFIFASSASVYGDTKDIKVKESFKLQPLHFYAYSKFLGEKMVEKYSKINGFKYYILRFFNIYGEKSNAVVAKFLAQFLQKKKITIYGNGNQSRDFVNVKDVCYAIKKIINSNINSNIFNIGSSKSLKIKELKDLISSKSKFINLKKRFDDIEVSIANISKAKKILRWYPKVSFSNGLQDMRINDSQRLLKIKLESIKKQKKLISEFNKKH